MTADELRNVLFYDPDNGLFTWRVRLSIRIAIGEIAGRVDKSTGYVKIGVFGRTYSAHRLAWLYMTSEWPKQQIDHINSNRADNRFANLREATNAQNGANRPAQTNNSSGFKGVTWHKQRNKWMAQIDVNGKHRYLGIYDTPEEAHGAYCVATTKLVGEFSRTS